MPPDSHDRPYARELLRPWKLATFGVAMAGLLYGALTFRICDWDVGITLLMGGLTYVCAPWSATMICTARERLSLRLLSIAAALASAWFVVDGAYVAYHTLAGNHMLRAENALASTPVYFLAGAVWRPRLALREMLAEVRTAFRGAS